MKLFGLLRKPAWESKDPAARLRAVQSGREAELLALIPELAQRDPDPSVRAAALRRVEDPLLLARRLRGENEASVAQVARERLLDRLCDAAVALDTRRAALGELIDADTLAELAARAPESELRRAALERSQRPGLIFERCLADPDPAIRAWLLTRIEDPDALERLADAARKRDKSLSRAARERLEALQLASGSEAAVQARVLHLCEQLARLSRELPPDREASLAMLSEEWNGLADRASDELQRRVQGYLVACARAFAGARGEVVREQTTAPAESAPEAPAQTALPEQEPDPALDDVIARVPDCTDEAALQLLQAECRALIASLPVSSAIAAQRQRFETAVDARRRVFREAREREEAARQEAAAQALAALESAVKAGSLAQARAAREILQGIVLPRTLHRRLTQADEGLAKLERWQRWSGNKARGRLCDEAEELPARGLHPDAVATRIKELQAEWARLDAIDGASAPAPDSGLARRFRALCHRAIAPAKPYFEKRRALRSEHAERIDELLQAIDVRLGEPAGDDLLPLKRRLGEALRDLDQVAPERRGEQGRALRERLTRLDAAISETLEQAVLAKRRLLARLRRDLGAVGGENALSAAKAAQVEWKRLPRGRRAEEDALWQEFRSLIDPLFTREREAEQGKRAALAEAEAAAQALLDEAESLAAADDDRLAHADSHLESLAARWRALALAAPEEEARAADPRRAERGGRGPAPARRRPHPMESRFDAAIARVKDACVRAAARRERRELQAICEAGRLLASARVEAADAALLESRLAPLSLPADVLGRFRAALAAGQSQAEAEDAGLLAVRAELAAGIESPDEALELRRAEQRLRLAAKLQGGLLPPPREEIREQLIQLQLGQGLPEQAHAALEARILSAYDKAMR
jgi:DNA repair protein SbcC/Rad50